MYTDLTCLNCRFLVCVLPNEEVIKMAPLQNHSMDSVQVPTLAA